MRINGFIIIMIVVTIMISSFIQPELMLCIRNVFSLIVNMVSDALSTTV